LEKYPEGKLTKNIKINGGTNLMTTLASSENACYEFS
jgi:hypothetical protein